MNQTSRNQVETVVTPDRPLSLPGSSLSRTSLAVALSTAAFANFSGTAMANDYEATSHRVPANHHFIMDKMPSYPTVDASLLALQVEADIKPTDLTETKDWFEKLDDKEKVELILDCLTGLALLGGLAVAGKRYKEGKSDWEEPKDKKEKIEYGATLFLNGKFSDLMIATGTAGAIDVAVQLSNAGGLAEGLLATAGLVFLGAAEAGADFDEKEAFEAAILNKIPASLAGIFAGLAEAGLHPNVEFGLAPLVVGGISYATLKAFNNHRIGSRRVIQEKYGDTFDFKIPALNSILGLLHALKFHENADQLRLALMAHDEAGILLKKGQDELEPGKQGALAEAYDRVISRQKKVHEQRQALLEAQAKEEGKQYQRERFSEAKTKKQFYDLRVSLGELIKIRTGEREPDHEWSPTAVLVADGHKSQGRHGKTPGNRAMEGN
jgi:hypothetical protein